MAGLGTRSSTEHDISGQVSGQVRFISGRAFGNRIYYSICDLFSLIFFHPRCIIRYVIPTYLPPT